MLLVTEVLEAAGYEHYEVANYSKPGYESKHNLAYWQGKPYLGIGESATTMTQNSERRMRVTDEHVEDDLSAKQIISEDCMLAMRTKYGIDQKLTDLARANFKNFDKVIQEFIDAGLVKESQGGFAPTEKG